VDWFAGIGDDYDYSSSLLERVGFASHISMFPCSSSVLRGPRCVLCGTAPPSFTTEKMQLFSTLLVKNA
jgi:hypothetical protein